MSKRLKYLIISIISLILYGNTLFHDYTLDDAIVISENEFTLNGFDGLKDIFSKDLFYGFFDQKNKKLVAGGRYRPLSVATFAIEWELFMGTPYDGLNKKDLNKKLNINAKPNYILPSNKILKDLSKTIHTDDRTLRSQQQDAILEKVGNLTDKEKKQIKSNLRDMRNNRSRLLFFSHLLNVLLYTLTCLVLLAVLDQLFKYDQSKKWYLSIPFITTIIFLVHPIHTEVVANIKGRDEILSLLGALISMLLVLKFLEKRNNYLVFFVFISYLIALFSKEIAIVFMLIIPISIYFFSDFKSNNKQTLFIMVPLILASLIYFYIRNNVLGGIHIEPSNELMNNSFLGMAKSEKFATIFYTLLLYLKLLIFPHPLTYDYYPYHIPVMNWTQLWPIISLIIYIAIGIIALSGLKKKSTIAYGLLFYLIALAPTSNLFFPIGVFMSERFIYVASIGIILIVSYLIIHKIRNPKIVLTVLIGIFVLFSIKTISRNTVWKNDFTLFTNDVKISKNSAKGNTTAGGKLIEEALKPVNESKRTEYLTDAIKYLNRAIKIYPQYTDAILLMGNAQWELYQSLDSTYKYYQKILEMNPLYERIYNNIFESRIVKVFDEPAKAESNVKILHDLEKYNPKSFKVNYYLGRIYGRYLNQLDKSINYLNKASIIEPENILVFKDLGVAYGISGRFKESAEAFEKAYSIDSTDPVLVLNLAMTYANLRDFQSTINTLDQLKQMKIDKEHLNVLIKAGNIYNNLGKKQKAKECFERAKKINP